MTRKLSLNEIKERQIKMLERFDNFCRSHNIPYFLSYGTLLGAVRHSGYIPWDDDVDVMVPRPYINYLVQCFKDDNYSILSITNCPTYDFPYPRMVDNSTFSKLGPIAKSYGINIDIYPIDAYPNCPNDEFLYRKNVNRARDRRLFVLKWFRRLAARLPIPNLPIANPFVKKHAIALAAADYDTALKVHVCWLETEPLDKSLFDDHVEVEFEGKKYYAPKNTDTILRNWYGDYMQLPPEDKRHPYHGTGNIFLEDTTINENTDI